MRSPGTVSLRNQIDSGHVQKQPEVLTPFNHKTKDERQRAPKAPKPVWSGDSQRLFSRHEQFGTLTLFPLSTAPPHKATHQFQSASTWRLPDSQNTSDHVNNLGRWAEDCCALEKILSWSQLRDPKPPATAGSAATFLQFSQRNSGQGAKGYTAAGNVNFRFICNVFLINSQTIMNHHLCSWGNRGERDPKLQLGICLPEL